MTDIEKLMLQQLQNLDHKLGMIASRIEDLSLRLADLAHTSKPQTSRTRSKKVVSIDVGNIIQLPDGRFRIDYVDSRGKRHRPAFATKDKAVVELGKIASQRIDHGQ